MLVISNSKTRLTVMTQGLSLLRPTALEGHAVRGAATRAHVADLVPVRSVRRIDLGAVAFRVGERLDQLLGVSL